MQNILVPDNVNMTQIIFRDKTATIISDPTLRQRWLYGDSVIIIFGAYVSLRKTHNFTYLVLLLYKQKNFATKFHTAKPGKRIRENGTETWLLYVKSHNMVIS